jgi:hypothetical protein
VLSDYEGSICRDSISNIEIKIIYATTKKMQASEEDTLMSHEVATITCAISLMFLSSLIISVKREAYMKTKVTYKIN